VSKETAGGKQEKLFEGKHDELREAGKQGNHRKEAMGAGGILGSRWN
jgi:hypothetical protein